MPNKKMKKQFEEICMQIDGPYRRYLVDIIKTVEKFINEGGEQLDLRILSMAIKEMRIGFKIFEKYKAFPKVSIFGSSRTPENREEYQTAKKFSSELGKRGYMVITGAGGGIMKAGHEGATKQRSIGLNIKLPFEQDPNSIIIGDEKLITFHYFFIRKLFFLKEATAVAYFPGGFGTHDELLEAITLVQTGKQTPLPILLIDKPGGTYWHYWNKYVKKHFYDNGYISQEDAHLYHITDDVSDALSYIDRFYANYHSLRFYNDIMILRLKQKLSDEKLAKINQAYKHLLRRGIFEQTKALPEERGEYPSLPRLIGKFDRKHFGMLHKLIIDLG